MLIAYLNHQFKYKEYAREFSFDDIKSWSQEKDKVTYGLEICLMPGKKLGSEILTNLGLAIGIPIGQGFACAWLLYQAVSTPVRMYKNKPGLLDECRRSRQLADSWEKKLQAAALLFQCKTEPPHVACKLEFELYARLKETAPKDGCFNDSTMRRTVDNLKAR
jgi:hypothetical protein